MTERALSYFLFLVSFKSFFSEDYSRGKNQKNLKNLKINLKSFMILVDNLYSFL